LKSAAIASAKRTFEVFGHRVEEFVEVLRPYPPIQLDRLETAGELIRSA